MAAVNLPDNPANGTTQTVGGITYTYNSSKGYWTAAASSGGGGGGGASVSTSDAAPGSPSDGDLWYDTDDGGMFVYYQDTDSSQWVEVIGSAGATGAAGAAGAAATGYGQVPIVYTEPSTTHSLNKDGSTSTVQMQAVDPEGTAITYGIAYANATNARPNQLATDTTINQSTGTFTFDPSTNSSHAGTFKARLSASDGITHATRFVDFSLAFTVDVDYLVIAGGGGGAAGSAGGGGGGAGGYRTGTGLSLTPGTTYSITVGAGGTGNPTSDGISASSTDGANSVFSTITATGGGGGQGGHASSPWAGPGRDGGSGGGGRYGGAGGAGTSGQGNDGGASTSAGSSGGGGGGGAGGAGADGTSGAGGAGGAGLASSITGSSVVRASGGAGGNTGSNTVAATTGGGGAGGTSANSTAGTANTGGGGGGNGSSAGAKDGGSGVVIIAAQEAAATVAGTYTVDTSGRSGWHVYTFTAGTGSITF